MSLAISMIPQGSVTAKYGIVLRDSESTLFMRQAMDALKEM